MTLRHAPRCLLLHPDRVGARHRCRARETSSRASRADITSSARRSARQTPPVSVKTRFTWELKQSQQSDSCAGQKSSASTSPCGQPILRGRLVERDESSIALHTCRGKTSSGVAKQCRSARQTPPMWRSASCPSPRKDFTLLFIECHCVFLHFVRFVLAPGHNPLHAGARGNLTLSQA